MTERPDLELLAEFAASQSEPAFAALVARHVHLVYSAAVRFTHNPHHAEEISQAVFVLLARKAGHLRPGTVLPGWLYQTTRLTAANFVKGERRRQCREQEAFMEANSKPTESENWEQIAPLLEEAMGRLGETDRDAIVLRYFENQTAQQIAATLKLNEAAARKRVARALGKLRKLFAKRGIVLTGVFLSGALAANAVQPAPAGLAATLAAVAGQGTLLSGATANLVNQTMQTIAWLKIKFAAGVVVAVLAIGGAAWMAHSSTNGRSNPEVSSFANYLTNRGWLQDFDGALNNSRFNPPGGSLKLGDRQYQGDSTWEASIQPGGYYVKTANFLRSGGALVAFTIGESPAEYWQVSQGGSTLSLAPKAPSQGGSDRNSRATLAEQFKQMLVTVLNLGIEGLDNRTVNWVSEKEFTSALVDFRGRPTNGTVRVTIEATDPNGLPLRLRGASVQGNEKKQFLVICRYDHSTLPPSSVIVEKTVNGVAWPRITNLVGNAVFGLRKEGAKGFSPADFLDGPPDRIMVESNGVIHASTLPGRNGK
jgi:RNA polymerase sigma factor (sigma-70 family)